MVYHVIPWYIFIMGVLLQPVEVLKHVGNFTIVTFEVALSIAIQHLFIKFILYYMNYNVSDSDK